MGKSEKFAFIVVTVLLVLLEFPALVIGVTVLELISLPFFFAMKREITGTRS